MEEVEKAITTGRLEALTDGIFAICMTILVLDLKVPDNIQDLGSLLPNLFTFFISFVVLGNYWVANHTEFRFIKKPDHKLIWLNIFFLLFICLMPFSASLLAKFSGQKIAVIIYGLNLFLATIFHMFAWIHATSAKLTSSQMPEKVITVGRQLSYLSLGPYLLAIILAFINTQISIAIYVLALIPYIFGIYYRLFGI